MKNLTDLYEKMISEGSLQDDRGQRVILKELEKVDHAISRSKAKSLFFKKTDNLKGVYTVSYTHLTLPTILLV